MEKVFEMRDVTVYLCEKDKMSYGTSSTDDVCAAIAAAGLASLFEGDFEKADTLGKFGILVIDGKYKQISEEELQKRLPAKSEDSPTESNIEEPEELEIIQAVITKAWCQRKLRAVMLHAINSPCGKWTDSFKEAEKKYLS